MGRGAEVADVGHARADEDFVDLVALHFREQLDVVRVVRAGDDGFLDVGEVDLDGRRVLGVGIRLKELRLGQPGFHGGDAAGQGARILVAVGDHPLHQCDVGAQVLDDRFLVEAHRAAGGGALGGGVGQLERLFHLEVGQAFDFEDAAGEDVLLALLLDGQQAGLDGVVRNGVDHVA